MFLQNVGKNLFDVFSIFACFYADSKIILFNIDFNMENKSYKKMCFPCYKLAQIKISSKRDRYSWTYLGCVDLLSKRKALYKNMGTYQNLKGEIKEIKVYCLTNQIQIDLIVYLQISQPPYYLAQIISQLLHYLNYFAVLDKFQLINEFM